MKHNTLASSACKIIRRCPAHLDVDGNRVEATTTRRIEIQLTDKRWEQLEFLSGRVGESITYEIEFILGNMERELAGRIEASKRHDLERQRKAIDAQLREVEAAI